ncbi:MAG TPA: fibronectin type III domain-containing protein [Porticoccus sp.]|nr:fibronectin type III domain-containing protein [Porticoccus sp.]
MKNLTTYSLAIVLLLLTACGGGGSSSGASDSDSNQNEAVVEVSNDLSATTVNVETEGSSLSLGGGVTQTTVTIETTQNITISWIPPAINSNGDPMDPSEISGYEIYYSSEDDSGSEGIITVDLGTTTEITVDNLAPGTYQFSIAAIEHG